MRGSGRESDHEARHDNERDAHHIHERIQAACCIEGDRITDPDEDEDRQRWQEHTAVILERNARSDHDTQQDRRKDPQTDPRAHAEQRDRKEQQ